MSDLPRRDFLNTAVRAAVASGWFARCAGDNRGESARQVHDSMSRAIEPFHTPLDGDVLYALTTRELANKDLNELVLASAASELA